MKFNRYKFLTALTIAGVAAIGVSCNKDVEDATPITTPATTGSTIAELINTDANFTFLRAAVTKASAGTSAFGASLSTLLSDRTAVFTVFAPTDAAFIASGFPSAAAVTAQRSGFLDTILRYHIVGGQKLTSAVISTAFPNTQEPTQLVLQAPSAAVPPGLRMSIFPSKRGSLLWANNIPLTAADIEAANGVIHRAATIIAPPSTFLWNRIDVDANLTFLKAAVQRADSGSAAANTLQAALQIPAANLTVFAPNNAAMQTFLIGSITQALVARGLPAASAQAAATALVTNYGTTILTSPVSIPDAPIFPAGTGIGVALATALTPTNVRGIVVYHLLGNRAFSNNIPTTATASPTLLNSAIPAHPGVSVQATFSGTNPYVVTAATVKGVANTTSSNILINPTPAPGGTSDQHYINGVLHVIDQALRPQ